MSKQAPWKSEGLDFPSQVKFHDVTLRDGEQQAAVRSRRRTSSRSPEASPRIAEADFVSLHVPLTDETRHLVDADSIAGMRRAPIIVNTARGPLVDMDAAVQALESGALAGVALDVTEVEPPRPDHPLRTHPRAVLTPHMGFYSVEAQAELQRRAAEEVARTLRGEPPQRPVNPDVVAGGSSR